jgi:DNA polymerase-3 subunit delta
VNAVPFFAERTLVEVRGFDVNKCRENAAEVLRGIASDIPDYCTTVFIMDTGYEPDGRLAAVKTLKKYGKSVEFTAQEQSQLLRWIARRCEAGGKQIGRSEAEHLIFCSGSLMNRLILEIDKLTAYAKDESITRADIEAVVERLPEADVFNMTDCLSRGDFDAAAAIMAELLQMREHPIMLLAMIGQQMRRLYTARLAIDRGLGRDYVAKVCDIKFDFIVNKLLAGAKGFTLPQLARAVELCAEYDYRMKSSGADDEELLCDLLLRLALGETDD